MIDEFSNKNNSRTGWIEVITGCMFSGKTEELIRRIKRAQYAHQRIEVFKAAVDNRYSEMELVSHDSNSFNSTPVDHSSKILLLSADANVVAIDEAQFFDMGLPEICNILANRGVRVIVAGLDIDYRGVPFGPMPALLAIAEQVTKVHAICVKCGNPAHYSNRITPESKLVVIGSGQVYESLCRECFTNNMQRTEK